MLNIYTSSESAIDWSQDCKPGKTSLKVQFKPATIEADSSSTKDKDIVEVIHSVTKAASKSKKSKT
jgi:hypothetical protein